MQSNLDKYKEDLKKLLDKGSMLLNAMQYETHPPEFEAAVIKSISKEGFDKLKKKLPSFTNDYQAWYSEAQAVIKLLLPDRLNDFIRFYEKPKATRKDITFDNYVIEDYLHSLTVTRGWEKEVIVGRSAAIPKFQQQYNILKAVQSRFESSLFDIKQLVQADLFDSELESARELNKNKFFRAAGAIGGVVLEKHLAQVANNHNLNLSKQHPTINDFNELLKQNGILDIAQWRFIQHLGDIRNICDHNKKVEPTSQQVTDLIDGVDKITKTLF
jgi:hypothetical protein